MNRRRRILGALFRGATYWDARLIGAMGSMR